MRTDSELKTEAELASEFLKIPEVRAAELRRKHRWPHVRLGRFDVRYTPAQVDQIIAMHSETPDAAKSTAGTSKIVGQTARSAGRKKSA